MSELTSNGGTRVYQNSISFRRNLKKHLARHALTPRTDFPTLPLPNPPTPLNYPSHQFPLSPTRSRLPKYPILSGVAQCSPHARPVPPPSYGIPCSLLGQRPGAFNCPLSVVMEEKIFSVRSVPGLPRASVFRSDTEAISPPL